MYGFEKYNDITYKHLLTKITQEKIFELAFQEDIILHNKYKSPFREDKNPGTFFIIREDNTILYVDFADTNITHRTCMQCVMERYKLTYDEAITFIINSYNLSKDIRDYNDIVIESDYNTGYNHSNHKKNKYINAPTTQISYIKSEYTKKDIIYWNQFLISIDNLIEDKVFSTHRFFIQKENESKKRVFNIHNLCYAIDFIDAVKIYQPQSKDYRFITNCSENHIGNFNNLPNNNEVLIISKSYKDHRVLRNINNNSKINVIWFQNETITPDEYIINNILDRFNEIIIFYDNDIKGIKKAIDLYEYFNSIKKDSTKIINLPFTLLRKEKSHKDIAQFVSREGRKETIEMLNQLNLNFFP